VNIPDDKLRQQLEALGVNIGGVEENFVRSQGAGGQNVNKVSTCVTLHYAPLGITIKMQDGRTQAGNRLTAWRLLREKVIDLKKAKASAERSKREQLRRQKRKRPNWLKREFVKLKTRRTSIKNARRSPVSDE
jgi:protein subunit release factor B